MSNHTESKSPATKSAIVVVKDPLEGDEPPKFPKQFGNDLAALSQSSEQPAEQPTVSAKTPPPPSIGVTC